MTIEIGKHAALAVKSAAGWSMAGLLKRLACAATVLLTAQAAWALPEPVRGEWGYFNRSGGQDYAYRMAFDADGGTIRFGHCDYAVANESSDSGFPVTLRRGPEECRQAGFVRFYRGSLGSGMFFRWGDAEGEWRQGTSGGRIFLKKWSSASADRFDAMYPPVAEGEAFPAAVDGPNTPGNAGFCPAVLEGIRLIVDDFGLDKMRPMVGRDTSPRIAAFLLDRNFGPRFGTTISAIPRSRQDAWSQGIRDCRGTETFAGIDRFYGGMARTLGSMLGFAFDKSNLPPYRFYLQAVAADEKLAAYLEGGFEAITPDMDGYRAGLQIHGEIVEELEIVRPSLVREVLDRVAAQRLAALEVVVDTEAGRLEDVGHSIESLSVVMPGDDLETTAVQSDAELRLLARLDTMRVDKMQDVVSAVLDGATDDEQMLSATRNLMQAVPDRVVAIRAGIMIAREKAVRSHVAKLTEDLAAITDMDGLERLKQHLNSVFVRRLDQGPAVPALVDAIASKEDELRQAAYRQGCTAHLAELGIDDGLHETAVVASSGTVPFWRFLCGMHDRGVRIDSFSAPGFFSSIYEIEATLPNGDFVTLSMKEAELGSQGTAFVGVEISNAVETTPFTLESWKQFVSQSSGQ